MKHYSVPTRLRMFRLKRAFMLLLCLGLSTAYSQEGEVGTFAERDSEPIRLTPLQLAAVGPNAQALPYEWSAAYLTNAFIKPGESIPLYLQDSSVCSVGLPNSAEFSENTKIFYSYGEGGRLEGIRFMQKQQDGSFQAYSQKLFEYEKNRQVRYRYQRWEKEWIDVYAESRYYDGAGRHIGLSTRELNESDVWTLQDSIAIRYDEAGNQAQIVGYMWKEGKWVPASRQMRTFNEEGNYTQILQQVWDGAEFETEVRERALYGPGGQRWLGYQLDLGTAIQDSLRPTLRERYEYDAFGYWTGTTLQITDSLTGEFQNQTREAYVFNRRGVWMGWTQQVWADDAWQNTLRQRFEGNPRNRQLIIEGYDTDEKTWLPAFRNFTRFDEAGNLVQEAGTQLYNPASKSWVNLSNARQCTHSWSRATPTSNKADLSSIGLECVFANPYSLHSPISCHAMEPGKVYDLSLLNMEGRRVLHKQVSGGSAFSLDRVVATGLYHMHIRESGLVRHLQKIVITRQ